jgi:hypothetical protein
MMHVSFLESHDGHRSRFDANVDDLPASETEVSEHHTVQDVTESSSLNPIYGDDDDDIFIPGKLDLVQGANQTPPHEDMQPGLTTQIRAPSPTAAPPAQQATLPPPRRSSRIVTSAAERLDKIRQENREAADRKAERLRDARQARTQKRKDTATASGLSPHPTTDNAPAGGEETSPVILGPEEEAPIRADAATDSADSGSADSRHRVEKIVGTFEEMGLIAKGSVEIDDLLAAMA